ncbi:MAG TPA: hypothetical protein PKU77_14335, partial [Ferruginibacter sp.]|nr:hypothetical protein [Ferruginibacter sp.]
YTKTDLSPLAADNFYRIKAFGLAGDITYSPIVKVAPEKIASLITVQPNPVKDKQLNIRFVGQQAGVYKLQLNNALGQLLHQALINVNTGNEIQSIQLSKDIPAANYQLSICDKNGKVIAAENILIQ